MEDPYISRASNPNAATGCPNLPLRKVHQAEAGGQWASGAALMF